VLRRQLHFLDRDRDLDPAMVITAVAQAKTQPWVFFSTQRMRARLVFELNFFPLDYVLKQQNVDQKDHTIAQEYLNICTCTMMKRSLSNRAA
jgi:hypothetical protein